MPKHHSTSTGARAGAPPEQLPDPIAAAMRAARLRAGLDERRVVELLADQGLEISIPTLLRSEESGQIQIAATTLPADAYGTPPETLAERRAYAPRHPNGDLPPALRSAG